MAPAHTVGMQPIEAISFNAVLLKLARRLDQIYGIRGLGGRCEATLSLPSALVAPSQLIMLNLTTCAMTDESRVS